ncbi:MAG: XAC2610-related protein [Bacteroidales bacterium]
MKIYYLVILILSVNSIVHAQKTDTTYYLEFNAEGLKMSEEGYILNGHKLKKEFLLMGKFPAKYLVEILNNDESVIQKKENDKWQTIDTIEQMFIEVDDSNRISIPNFRIEDFNKDGNQDIICQTGTNVNGNDWVQIYLNDPKTKSLIKLHNSAEDESDTWDAPEYNKKDSTIHCTHVSGNFGYSFESTYKLIRYQAIPIKKFERDNTKMTSSGKGSIKRYFIGNQGKWKLLE